MPCEESTDRMQGWTLAPDEHAGFYADRRDSNGGIVYRGSVTRAGSIVRACHHPHPTKDEARACALGAPTLSMDEED